MTDRIEFDSDHAHDMYSAPTTTHEAVRLASRLLVNGLDADEEQVVAALLCRIPELEAELQTALGQVRYLMKDQEAKVAERDQLRAELEKVKPRPIDTAPKGEQVFLFSSHSLDWFVDDWGRYAKYNSPSITHWMPLPASPTPPNADQKGQ